MAELSSRARDHLKDDQFAYIDSKGGRHLPTLDEDHVRNAIARFSQTDFESAGDKKKAAQAILKAAKKYGIEVGEDDAVSRAAH